MSKLQYDSFYKFIVSLGTILIAAPLVGIYYLLTGSYNIIISQKQYKELSSLSLQFLQSRSHLINVFFNLLPWIFFILIGIGLFCIIWGGLKWYKIQKTLDENIQIEVDEKKYNYKQLTASEVAEKAAKEANEAQESNKTQDTNKAQDTIEIQDVNDTSSLSNQEKKIIKYLQIEQACFYFLNNELTNKYLIKQNVRVGQNELDILAISKKNKIDLIYEIKYWNNKHLFKPALLSNLNRMNSIGIEYRSSTNRNYECILLIVTNSNSIDSIKKNIERYISESNKDFQNIKYEVIKEDDLNKYNKNASPYF